MPLLQDILYKVSIKTLQGRTDLDVTDIQSDSRRVTPGACFVAISGIRQDGHQHISGAIRNGAVVVVCQVLPDETVSGITYVVTNDAASAAGLMANAFFGSPSSRLKLVGVTGTNGKTTVATLLYKLFSALDVNVGLLSTVENRIGDRVVPATHTTPDAISLHALLKQMVDAGCTHAFMEVSSHAIHQQRIAGVTFNGGVFTNITHDHLDYHKTFEEYIRVKKNFFDHLPAEAFAISNMDDRNGAVMLQNTRADKFYYSLRSIADFKGRIIDSSIAGLQMLVNEQEVHFRLLGEFNAYNLLAVYATAICLGEDRLDVLQTLSNLTGATGRFDQVHSATGIIGIVDYAHTPDALLNVLATIRKFLKGGEQLITVVGCGGDRDRSKRPLMAQAAAEFSTRAIFTSDNPRSEDPSAILQEMNAGLDALQLRKVLTIADRREAIRAAIMMANAGDIVLVAGKGHENYQEVNGVKYPFDDREVLENIFNNLEK